MEERARDGADLVKWRPLKRCRSMSLRQIPFSGRKNEKPGLRL